MSICRLILVKSPAYCLPWSSKDDSNLTTQSIYCLWASDIKYIVEGSGLRKAIGLHRHPLQCAAKQTTNQMHSARKLKHLVDVTAYTTLLIHLLYVLVRIEMDAVTALIVECILHATINKSAPHGPLATNNCRWLYPSHPLQVINWLLDTNILRGVGFGEMSLIFIEIPLVTSLLN